MASKSGALLMLLLVAVMSCSSGAQGSTVDLFNSCNNDTLVLLYNSTVNEILIPAGQSVGIDLSSLQGIISPVFIRENGTLFVIPLPVVGDILAGTGLLYQIEIACNGECGNEILTIKPTAQLYVLGVKVGPPITSTFCADVVVPGLGFPPLPAPVPSP